MADEGTDTKAKRARRLRILGMVMLVAALAGLVRWLLVRNIESTDDAFVDGTVIQVAPQVGGRVTAVHFNDFDAVAAGTVLVDIDPSDTLAQRAAAEANLNSAHARRQSAQAGLDLIRVTSGADYTRAENALAGARQQVAQARSTAEAAHADSTRAEADTKRYQDLFQSHNASRQRMEQAQAEARSTAARWRAAQAAVAAAESAVAQAEAQLRSAGTVAVQIRAKEAELSLAEAGVSQAEALLAMADLALSYTHVTAPAAGRVSRRAVAAGDMVQKGQVLTQMVSGPLWVTANFKETQLTRMRPGQSVTIGVDAYPSLKLHGTVEGVQPATGARFSLLPPENATGNFVKIVQRVPVKITLDAADATSPLLSLGMSVVPEVDVGSGK